MPGAITPATLSVFRVIFDIFTLRLVRSRLPKLYDGSPYANGLSTNIGKKTFMNYSKVTSSSQTRCTQPIFAMSLGNDMRTASRRPLSRVYLA